MYVAINKWHIIFQNFLRILFFFLARESVIRYFIISNVSVANIILCSWQHVAIELQIEWVCINPLVLKLTTINMRVQLKCLKSHKDFAKNVQSNVFAFKVCKSVHHRTFQINRPTRCNNFSSLLLDVYSYVRLNMSRASSRPSSGAQQLQ